MKLLAYKVCVFSLLFLLSITCVFSQKVELSLGIGVPDALNVKLKIGKKLQLGVSAGFMPNLGRSFCGDIYYRIIGEPELPNCYKWYLNSGLSFQPNDASDPNYSSRCLYFRIGRVINFTDRAGINFDVGVVREIWNDERIYKPLGRGSTYAEKEYLTMPAGSISYFLKF